MKQVIRSLINKLGYEISKVDTKTTPKDEKYESLILPDYLLENCKVLPTRKEALFQIPKNGVIAEIGVAYGHFTRELLDILQPKEFQALDTFDIQAGAELWSSSRLSDSGLSHIEYFKREFQKEMNDGILKLVKGFSWEVLNRFPDEYFDYIYVDADHSYKAVVKDIEVAAKKIKPEGIIQFNDYCAAFPKVNDFWCGVPKAVNEFMIKYDYEMIFYCLHHMNCNDVVVRKCMK